MAVSNSNPLMPFLEARAATTDNYARVQAINNQTQHGDMQIAGALSGMQEKQALKAALASGDIGAVARINPEAAGVLAKLQETQRQSAFYSPQNLAQFQTPGVPGIAPGADEFGGGPGRPEVAPSTNLPAMALAGAAQGIKGTEPLLNHMAQRDAARASLAQTGAIARERIDAQLEMARQRSEDRAASEVDRRQAREDMIRLSASLRQPHQPQIVQTADGIYSVGADRVPQPMLDPNTQKPLMPKGAGTNSKSVQNLGTAFEKAGLSVTNQAVNDAETAVAKPEILSYLTGPQKLIPDFALSKEVTDARQAIEKVFNITLKDRSGAAVTNQELARLKSEFGAGVFKKPEQLKTAIDRARQIVDTHYRGIAAGFGPDTLGAYNENLQGMGGQPILQAAPTPQNRRANDKASIFDQADAILKGK